MKYLVIGGVVVFIAYLVAGSYIVGQFASATGSTLHDPPQPTTLGRINLSGSPFVSRSRPISVA